MANIILVAYSLKPSATKLKLPTPTAPKRWKDEQKIAEYVAAKQEEQQALVAEVPYGATFDHVVTVDVAKEDKASYHSKGREPGGSKVPISVAVRSYCLKRYPKGWPEGFDGPEAKDAVYFVGFNVKRFLKIMGIECSLPEFQPRDAEGKEDVNKDSNLPLSMWLGNSNHRDIETIVIPKDYKDVLSWPTVLSARGLGDKFSEWKGPHVDPEMDILLISELAAQVGLFKQA